NYILVQKGMINREKFYIPKDQAESYDGDVLRFRFSEQDLSQFQREPLNIYGENSMQEQKTSQATKTETEQEEENIPLTEERVDVSKRLEENQATIFKEPIKETKTVEVPLTREEVSIERRPPSSDGSGSSNETETQSPPIQSPQEIKIPLKKEEAEVTKKPYVKKVAVKKKAKTNKKKVTKDVVTSEELDTANIDK
ncbi:MAG TPA: DUF2382 domain-containing protein, partial [Nitrososphaeraceae archaeon]|nr:DUF2382 domain-containing protein [Nitrososphaeraceae archaeon]